jgi:tight adherence protein B
MSFEFDSVYLVYLLAVVSAVLLFEGVYLLFFSGTSYRSNVNRRLKLLKNESNREALLVQLRRERGLSGSGGYAFGLESLNRLVIQSGLTVGNTKLLVIALLAGAAAGVVELVFRKSPVEAAVVALLVSTVLPLLVLRFLRGRRRKKFAAQLPDALDMIVRSMRAGHPVPIAISMVAREMPDPIGSEFGMVTDEVTYGADLETALRNLSTRIGQDDLPLFVTAVAIQGSTGGNLGEILHNLSSVIRDRFKMRRKIRAMASEGRASAIILSALPILIFVGVQTFSPDFYGAVWHEDLTKIVLGLAGCWMAMGNFIMYRLVNFKF